MKINIINSLVAIIILMAISLSVQTCRVNRTIEKLSEAEADKASALQFVNDEKHKTESYINKFNNVVARNKIIDMSLSNLVALRNTERLKHLRQIEGLKKDLKNLESSINVDVEIDEDSIPVTTVYIPCKDSLKVFNYQLIDEFNTINALVVDTPRFQINVPIRSAIYWQRAKKILWFRIGSKQYFIESFSPNKLVKIEEQEVIKVTKR